MIVSLTVLAKWFVVLASEAVELALLLQAVIPGLSATDDVLRCDIVNEMVIPKEFKDFNPFCYALCPSTDVNTFYPVNGNYTNSSFGYMGFEGGVLDGSWGDICNQEYQDSCVSQNVVCPIKCKIVPPPPTVVVLMAEIIALFVVENLIQCLKIGRAQEDEQNYKILTHLGVVLSVSQLTMVCRFGVTSCRPAIEQSESILLGVTLVVVLAGLVVWAWLQCTNRPGHTMGVVLLSGVGAIIILAVGGITLKTESERGIINYAGIVLYCVDIVLSIVKSCGFGGLIAKTVALYEGA